MEEKNKSFIIVLLRIWITVLIIFIFIVFILNPLGIKVLLFNISPNFTNLILFLGILTCPIIFWIPKKREIKWLKIAYNIIAPIAIIFTIIIYLFFFSELKYFNFKSPNGNRTLVIEEDSFLLLGRSNFYERKYGIFIKSLNQEITTDDGFRPFTNNNYNISWEDNDTVKVEYDFGSSGIWKKEIVTFIENIS